MDLNLLEVDCTQCQGTGKVDTDKWFLGTCLQRPCYHCKQGKVPSELGLQLLEFINKHGFPSLDNLENEVNKLDQRLDNLEPINRYM